MKISEPVAFLLVSIILFAMHVQVHSCTFNNGPNGSFSHCVRFGNICKAGLVSPS